MDEKDNNNNNNNKCFFFKIRNETVRFRVYELIVRVAGSSTQAFELGENSGLLDGFMNEVQSTDTLVALNAIEILRQVMEKME